MKKMFIICAAICGLTVSDVLAQQGRQNFISDTAKRTRARAITMNQGSTQIIGWTFTNSLTGPHDFSTVTEVKWTYYDAGRTFEVSVDGVVESALAGKVRISIPLDKLATNTLGGSFDWRLEVASATSRLAYAFGPLTIIEDPGASGPPVLVTVTNIDWSNYIYSNTDLFGAYRFPGNNLLTTINPDGSINVTTRTDIVTGGTNITVVNGSINIDITETMDFHDNSITNLSTNSVFFVDGSKISIVSTGGLDLVFTPFGGSPIILSGLNVADLDPLNASIGQNASRITGNAIDIDRNVGNILVNQFHILSDSGAGKADMINGRADFFNNQDDVNTGAGANFTFLSGEQAYQFEELVSRDFTTNLIALWRCNDNAANTTVTDSSGSGNTGVATVNTDTLSAVGKVNDAFFLSRASTERFNVASLAEAYHEGFATQGRGIMFWERLLDWTPASPNTFQKTLRNSSPFIQVMLHQTFTGTIFIRLRSDNGENIIADVTDNAAFLDDTWHHFAVSWDPSVDVLQAWVDGVLKISVTNTSINTFNDFLASHTFTIGAANRDGVFNEGDDGGVDAIYLLERPLFQDDVTVNYNLGVGTEELIFSKGGDLEIRSNVFTAETEPAEGYAMVLLENTSGWTINSDVTVFLSKDGGTTLDSVPLTFVGDFLPGIGMYTGTNLLTSTGVSMVIVVKSANDAAGKLHGWAPAWK